VLRDISFKADKGETVAFIGSTGSGKSTIVNLLLRSYDVTDGKVLVDGVDVRDYTQEALHQKMGYVPQKATLFSGTVFSNVAYGDMSSERTEADVRTAVTIAQGAEFVEAMDGRYNASIAQGGTNVSGGQKQRLSIARAVCRRPEIYIFDDSFSALDYRTDRCLRSALKKETADVTSIIVAQRVGTIMDADKIVVLDNGSVAGIGKHRQLLDTCPVYREIVESQLTEEDMRR
jgi:ATP-binding cassette subfamily B protein